MILNPLQRVQVLESKKKCKAGSTGYFVAQDPINNFNGWDMCVVFTRFGKKGKPRVEPLLIRPRMIDYGTMKPSDQIIMEGAGVHEGIEPRLYPDRRGRVSGKIGDTKLEPIPSGPRDMLNAPDEEFTAYIVAVSLFIHKMVHRKHVRHMKQIPVLQSKQFVRKRFDLTGISPEILGYYILYGMQYDVKGYNRALLEAEGTTFTESLAAQINTPAKKRNLLDGLRKSFAMSKSALVAYQKNIEDSFHHLSDRMDDVLKYYRHRKKALEEAKRDTQNRGWYIDIKERGR